MQSLALELNLQEFENHQPIILKNCICAFDVQFGIAHQLFGKFVLTDVVFKGSFSFEGNHFKDKAIIKNCVFQKLTKKASLQTCPQTMEKNLIIWLYGKKIRGTAINLYENGKHQIRIDDFWSP